MKHQSHSGFTLVELMVVVAIMGILAAAAAPSVIARLPQQRLSRANWQVYMDLHEAKSRAVSENQSIVVTINSGAGSYNFWADVNDNGTRDTGEVITNDLSDMADVSLTGYPSTFTFNPDGTMDSTYYYAYIRVLEPRAGNKTIYAFPNGSIDGHRVQNM